MKKAIAAIALLALPSMASAELISTNWQSENDSLATLDKTTGLEWLDLTVTDGMSVNQVLSDSRFDNWRLATGQEVKKLISYYLGVEGVNTATKVLDDETFQMWQGFFGITGPEGRSMGKYMIGDNSYMAGTRNSGTVYTQYSRGGIDNNNGYDGIFLVSEGGTTLSSIQDPSINTPINATSVPLSATLTMSMIGLMAFRRKKQ